MNITVKAASQIGHAGKVTRNICRVVIQTTMFQNDIPSMLLALCRIGSSDNHSNHFTKLLPLVPFWAHTNVMMGAQFLTKHPQLGHLRFDPVPHNCHTIASLFGVYLSSYPAASKLRGVKENESKESIESLESKQADEGLSSVYPSTDGL